jgi:hypothetical protein
MARLARVVAGVRKRRTNPFPFFFIFFSGPFFEPPPSAHGARVEPSFDRLILSLSKDEPRR